jgi:hypothetical protein
VLVSPIAFENLSASRDLPDGIKENANLALYTAAIEKVAKAHDLTFIDLFTPTRELYAKAEQALSPSTASLPLKPAISELAANACQRPLRPSVAQVQSRSLPSCMLR